MNGWRRLRWDAERGCFLGWSAMGGGIVFTVPPSIPAQEYTRRLRRSLTLQSPYFPVHTAQDLLEVDKQFRQTIMDCEQYVQLIGEQGIEVLAGYATEGTGDKKKTSP